MSAGCSISAPCRATVAPEDAHSGIIIPLRNMINEAYALDTGRKIRAQQRQAMKDGKFIGARTPYI